MNLERKSSYFPSKFLKNTLKNTGLFTLRKQYSCKPKRFLHFIHKYSFTHKKHDKI